MFRLLRLSCVALSLLVFFTPLRGQSTQTLTKHIFPSRNNPGGGNQGVGGGVALSGTAGNGITYHGGPLMLGTANVYLIFYGNWAADPTGISILQHFVQFEGGSPYYAINTTYYDGNGTNISNSINLAGTYTDNYSRGTVLGD